MILCPVRGMNTADEVEQALRNVIAYVRETESPSRARIASELERLSADLTQSRIAAAGSPADYAPDPLTFRAFMSEFKQGVKAGAQEALDVSDGFHQGPGPYELERVAEDTVVTAARDIMEYMKRITIIAGRGTVGVNERKLVPRISGLLSTFFYNL